MLAMRTFYEELEKRNSPPFPGLLVQEFYGASSILVTATRSCIVSNMPIFMDRADAGRQLAAELSSYVRRNDVIVLALPRGGVPVAYEIAKTLHAPLDVFVVRKLGVPGHQEVAMGAVATGGRCVVDEAVMRRAGVTPQQFQAVFAQEREELKRREAAYRDDRPGPAVAGSTVIVVDDGLATGASMYSAVAALRRYEPAQVVVAIPVAPFETCAWLRQVADRVVCPNQLAYFGAVGFYYANFAQVTDDEVRNLLSRAELEREQWKVA